MLYPRVGCRDRTVGLRPADQVALPGQADAHLTGLGGDAQPVQRQHGVGLVCAGEQHLHAPSRVLHDLVRAPQAAPQGEVADHGGGQVDERGDVVADPVVQ